MAKLFMDLKHYTKVATDGKSSTLKHPAGHEFRIAHAGLSPKNLEALHSLPLHKAKGGEIKGNAKLSESKKQPPAGKIPGEEKLDALEKGAEGFHVLYDKKKMADGGYVADSNQGPPSPQEDGIESDPVGNGLIDTVVTLGAAPAIEGAVADAGKVAGNEIGSIGSDVANEGLIHRVLMEHGMDPDQAASAASKLSQIAQPTMRDMQAETAAKNAQFAREAMLKGGRKKMADGGDVSLMDNEPMQPAPSPDDSQMNMLPQVPDSKPGDDLQQPQQVAPDDSQAPQQSEKPDPFGVNATANAYTTGIEQGMQGIQDQAKAAGAEAALQAKAYTEAQNQQQLNAAAYQNHYNELDQERKAFQQDYENGHIDPQHYWNSKSDASKVMTAIGIALGGLAGGGHNPALEFFQNNVNRDIEAQKAELGKKDNLLSANLRQFGNMRDAADMTRVMKNDMLSSQIKAAAAKTGGMTAKANAEQLLGRLQMDTAQTQGQMAMRKTILGNMQAGQVRPEQVINALVPAEKQGEATKELQSAQTAHALRNDTLKAFDAVNKEATAGNLLNPQSYARANAIWGATMDKLTKDTSGRVTPETVSLMSSLRPSTRDTPETTAMKRTKLNDILSQGMHYPTLDYYGIKMSNTGDGAPGGQNNLRTRQR